MKNIIDFIDNEKIGEYKENVSFKELTTYKCGGNAKLVVYPTDILCLKKILKFLDEKNIGYKILGNGSNVIFNICHASIVLLSFGFSSF